MSGLGGPAAARHGVRDADRPTLFQVMREPRWIAALVFALLLAAIFAALGRWQAERAVSDGDLISYPTETVMPLTTAIAPGAEMRDSLIGQRIRVEAAFVPNDYEIIADRVNHGATGYWVVGHAIVDPAGRDRSASLAVARGWAPTAKAADAAVERLATLRQEDSTILGRLLPDEGPVRPPAGSNPREMTTMSPAALYNLWHDVAGTDVYTAYVVQTQVPAGLTPINSPPPIPPQAVNWLNVFYAIEWAVFAGFAIFLWYRLARDEWEKRIEDLEDAESIDPADPAFSGENVH